MKEFRVQVPEGMEIDKENSTFECIKFKPIEKKEWNYDLGSKISGYWIDNTSTIISSSSYLTESNIDCDVNVFSTKEEALSALAMAQISQIREHNQDIYGPKLGLNDIAAIQQKKKTCLLN